MKVSKQWLENKITDLNWWLWFNPSSHSDYKQKTGNRDYYVNKLIELEESKLSMIKV